MARKMTVLGVGPHVVASGIFTDIVAGALAYMYPEKSVIPAGKHHIPILIGIVLLLAGIIVILASARHIVKAFRDGKLVTTGPYSWSRNPIYASYILLIMPAFALMCRVWLMFAASLVMYGIFKFVIRKEAAFLGEKFGDDYARYRASTNELLFCPPRKV